MGKLKTVLLLSSDSDTGTGTKQILSDSIPNTIPTEINGFCQDNTDYTAVRGANAGEAKRNVRGIPGEQSSSLSFLDPPL